MNSPATPGQKIKGKNAANVVSVDAITGLVIFLAAKWKIEDNFSFSEALLFAYSTTIIAPSIKIPTDKIKENKTTTFIVTLNNDKKIIITQYKKKE